MLFFHSRKRTLSTYLPDGMDWHCHILPGVDDGSPSWEVSLSLIREMKKAGMKGACCTPHIMNRFPNKAGALRERFAELAERAAAEGFELRLAAEYMIDDTFETTLQQEELLPWGTARHLLVELPQYMLPPGWMDSLSLVQRLGYTPVLAHPERYGRVLDMEDLEYIASQGVLFQGSIGALSGYYGRQVMAIARGLLKRGLYHCWGTDAHSLEMLRRVIRL